MIGADGANSRVAKDIDAGEYDYAIAFQASRGLTGSHAIQLCGLPGLAGASGRVCKVVRPCCCPAARGAQKVCGGGGGSAGLQQGTGQLLGTRPSRIACAFLPAHVCPGARLQERIRIPDDKMDYYKDLAEM